MKDIAYTQPTSHDTEIPFIITGDTLSGIELLAQRVLTVLCTNVEETLRELEGTSILDPLGNGNIVSSTVKMLITSAASTVLTIIKDSEDSDMTDEDKIQDIEIDDVVCSGDKISCQITVSNVAEEATTTSTTYEL